MFYAIRDSRSHREQRQLRETMAALIAKADALAEPNAFGALLQREGAQGLNASTSHDATRYYCALPANKLELWFALESERFQVLREEETGAFFCRRGPVQPLPLQRQGPVSCSRPPAEQSSGRWLLTAGHGAGPPPL